MSGYHCYSVLAEQWGECGRRQATEGARFREPRDCSSRQVESWSSSRWVPLTLLGILPDVIFNVNTCVKKLKWSEIWHDKSRWYVVYFWLSVHDKLNVCLGMYVYVCMCLYVYVCVYLCMCWYVYACVCVYLWVCACVCLCVRLCVYMYECLCACMYNCVCVNMYVCLCICMCMCVPKTILEYLAM